MLQLNLVAPPQAEAHSLCDDRRLLLARVSAECYCVELADLSEVTCEPPQWYFTWAVPCYQVPAACQQLSFELQEALWLMQGGSKLCHSSDGP